MSIKEWIAGTGIYRVGSKAMGPQTWFLRAQSTHGEFQPLLHICEKDQDPTEAWICVTGVLRWCIQGYYECRECKKRYSTAAELTAVWEDGKGTGDEGHA